MNIQAMLACASYAVCSTLLTLANKVIFSENKLNYPWSLLEAQSIMVMLLLLMYYSCDREHSLLKRQLLKEMLLPCTFFTMFIFTNARALRYISIPVLTVVKSLAPICVALVERLLFKEKVSRGTYSAMALIVCGNVVTVSRDVHMESLGYFWAILNVAMNVCYVVSLRYFLSDCFTSGEKTLHSNLLAATMIAPAAIAAGEWPNFFEEIGETTMKFKILFLMSCVLAAGIGASVFWVIHTTSGSTLSFIGAANKVIVVVFGALLFETKISRAGWIGVVMGTLASFVFAAAKAHAKFDDINPTHGRVKREETSSIDAKPREFAVVTKEPTRKE